jgi:murein DD-endopeptidase MepM/ murein hydrolase activator NlpD
MTITERGRFRSIAMDVLQSHATDSLWDREESSGIYAYPARFSPSVRAAGEELAAGIEEKNLKELGPFLGCDSPQSHIGPFCNAVDFLIPDGTEVLAAAEGVVIEMQEASDAWGDGPEFRDTLNYLTIQHEGGEFTQYSHLAQGSASGSGIKIGSQVARGQVVAVVGKTGWTDRDHLHFVVYREDINADNPFGFKSLVPRFE